MRSTKNSSSETQLTRWRTPCVSYFIAAGIPGVEIKVGVITRATPLDRAINHQIVEPKRPIFTVA